MSTMVSIGVPSGAVRRYVPRVPAVPLRIFPYSVRFASGYAGRVSSPHLRSLLRQSVCAVAVGILTLARALAAEPAATRSDLDSTLTLAANRAHGQILFQVCASCHRDRPGALPAGWAPRIEGQHSRVIIKQLIDYRHGARWDQRMEVVAGRHVLASLQDIADVATYAASIDPATAPQSGDGENLSAGHRIYARACAQCHRANGLGNGMRLIPRLAGQDAAYLLRQLHDALEGRRPGLESHAELLETLDKAQLEGVADYLSRLPGRSIAARSRMEMPDIERVVH